MIKSTAMQNQLQVLKTEVDKQYKASIFTNDPDADARYERARITYKVATYICEVADWARVAFTSEDIESAIPSLRTNDYWKYFDFLVTGHLESIGIIKRFGKKAWRMSTTTAGPMVDVAGNFAGQLEVMENTSPVNNFRSYLISNEASLLATSGGEGN